MSHLRLVTFTIYVIISLLIVTLFVLYITMNNRISNHESRLDTEAMNIAEAIQRTKAITEAVKVNEKDITVNKAYIATNEANITTNKSKIATNEVNITTNEAKNATNEANISTNEANITTNESNITTNISSITTNNSRITTNKSNITLNTEKITAATSSPVFDSSTSVDILDTHNISDAIYTATFSSSSENVTDFAILSHTHTSDIITSPIDGIFELFLVDEIARGQVFNVELVATDITNGNRSDPFTVEFQVKTIPAFSPTSKEIYIPLNTGPGEVIELNQCDVTFEDVTYSVIVDDPSSSDHYEVTQPESSDAFVIVTTLKTLDRRTNGLYYNFTLMATMNSSGAQGGLYVVVDTSA